MIRKYFLPLLAATGALFAMWMVTNTTRPVPAAQPVVEPARSSFSSFVAGTGLVEASTENIAIGTHVAGVVTQMFVVVGSTAKAGDPLFTLDDRALQAQLAVRKTALQEAQEKLARLVSAPRAEEIPPAEARVKEAEALRADAQQQLVLMESVTDKRAISREELSRRRFAVQVEEAKVAAARAQLALLKAGTWKPDLDVAKAEVAAAEAQVKATEMDIERLTVRAPVEGQVLQVKVRAGEYAQTGVLQTPLILLGNVDRLHVRVDVDEHDAWRVRAGAPATASVRGNPDLKTAVQFVRFEPFIIPKRSLTGDSSERVDTRVLQVLYSFERGQLPIYVGQQMDIFIEAPPMLAESGSAARRTQTDTE